MRYFDILSYMSKPPLKYLIHYILYNLLINSTLFISYKIVSPQLGGEDSKGEENMFIQVKKLYFILIPTINKYQTFS